MGRKKLQDQSKIKNKFSGFFMNEEEHEWLSNKANISQFIRTKALEDFYKQKEEEETKD